MTYKACSKNGLVILIMIPAGFFPRKRDAKKSLLLFVLISRTADPQ